MKNAQLIERLTDEDDDARRKAYERLIDIDDETARAILDIARGDAAERIRADAVVALGPVIEECGWDYDDDGEPLEIPYDPGPAVSRKMFASIIDTIEGMYRDESQPKLIRRRCFEVLVRAPRPWHATEIPKLFASPDEDWRLTAVFAMGMIRGFEKEIAATVETADGTLLSEAVRAAGAMEVSEVADRIRSLAESGGTELDLRLEAILALPGVDLGCLDLIDELADSDDPEIAAAAEEARDDLMVRGSAFELEDDFDEDEDF